MRDNTFGNSRAAIRLAGLVKDAPKLRRRVSDVLTSFSTGLDILPQKWKGQSKTIADLWLNFNLNRGRTFNLPVMVHDLLCNVIRARYREALRRHK
jgi:hypothetical protein